MGPDMYYNGLRVRAIYGDGRRMTRIYRDGKLVWQGGEYVRLSALARLQAAGECVLSPAVAAALAGASETQINGAGSLSPAGCAAGAADAPLETVSAAGLYVRRVSNCAGAQGGALEPEAQANAPLASPCAAGESAAAFGDAAANAPAAAPCGTETGLKVTSGGAAAAAPARPLAGCWVWAFPVHVQAVLTAAPAAAAEMMETVRAGHTADLNCKDMAWKEAVLENGILTIRQAHEAARDGDALMIY